MHKFDKSTVTFDDPSTWGELASLKKGRASLFSYTNTPDGWGHTTKFSSSKRFEPFDKDKLSYPSLGAYETNVSTVELPTPSITRPSAQPRRPRVTAPAAGATATARLWGQDKWLETPDPGPGAYETVLTSFEAGRRGEASFFMRSSAPRFSDDPKHVDPTDRARQRKKEKMARRIAAMQAESGVGAGAGGGAGAGAASRATSSPGQKRRTRFQSVADRRRPVSKQERGRHAGSNRPAAHQQSLTVSPTPEFEDSYGDVAPIWAPAPSLLSRFGATRSPYADINQDAVARKLRPRNLRGEVLLTPAERRKQFRARQELEAVEELDIFSFQQQGKHDKARRVKEALDRERNERARQRMNSPQL